MGCFVRGIFCRSAMLFRVPSIRILHGAISLHHGVARRFVRFYLRVHVYSHAYGYGLRQTITFCYFYNLQCLVSHKCVICFCHRVRVLLSYFSVPSVSHQVCSIVSQVIPSVSLFVGHHIVPTSIDFSSRGSTTSTEGLQRVSSCYKIFYYHSLTVTQDDHSPSSASVWVNAAYRLPGCLYVF